jgi:DNA-binding XRE family transcriptional regulator
MYNSSTKSEATQKAYQPSLKVQPKRSSWAHGATVLLCLSTSVILPVQMDLEQSNAISSGSQWIYGIPSSDLNSQSDTLDSVPNKIKKAKITLGLSNKDLASIYDTTRQSLHSYSQPDSTQIISTATSARIDQVSEVISGLQHIFPKSPAAMAKNYTEDGESLFDMLCKDEIPVQAVFALSEKLAAKMNTHSEGTRQSNELSLHELTRSV